MKKIKMGKVYDKKRIDRFAICLIDIMEHDTEWPQRYQKATGKNPWRNNQSVNPQKDRG